MSWGVPDHSDPETLHQPWNKRLQHTTFPQGPQQLELATTAYIYASWKIEDFASGKARGISGENF